MRGTVWIFILFLQSTMSLLNSRKKTSPKLDRESFEDVVKSKTFVDKSMFIKLFFDRDHNMYVTAPRGFGKTTAMNMLKTFLEIQTDEKGKAQHANETSNYRLFDDNNLAIFAYGDDQFIKDYFGTFPVAHFRFDRLKVGNSYKDFMRSYQDVLSEAYSEHPYLADSPHLDKNEKSDYLQMVAKNETGWLTQRGKDLTQLLFTHFCERECIVLIDDFDAPLAQMVGNKKVPPEDVESIHNFLKGFLVNLVKANFFSNKALITASVRIVPPDVNSRFEQVNKVINTPFSADEEIADFYGFREEEVEDMARKLGKESELPTIRKWYSGYPVEDSDSKLYNMYSIVNYFKAGTPAPYWTDSGNVMQLLKPFLIDGLFKAAVDGSLESNNTKMKLLDGPYPFNTRNINAMKNAFNDPATAVKNVFMKNLLLKYMTDHGYYPAKSSRHYKGYIEGVVPNFEVWKRIEEFLNLNPLQ